MGMGGHGRGRGHGFGGHGHGRHHGGRRRRMFDGDELRLLLLALIAETPRHGYDLIREIESRTGGQYAPSPGVVYPTVTMLTEMDLIAEQDSEGAKKTFGVTDAGRAHLEEHEADLKMLFARLDQLGSMGARTSDGPVRRAMGNLRTVLQQRMSAEDVKPEMLHDVADILDDAARRIERL
ncbi:DNA-binding PadR family transcriptional regulator [Stakelama sediminis]|uniref:DNA-binding PadR family transcriptional regulator n=2 Tax=Stakelama sediminis TaxID=463200 RepID=A0A840YWI5_9SPHN|nr:DNA-binding PadR family transcriptional regulator [Stakelama sediminis]